MVENKVDAHSEGTERKVLIVEDAPVSLEILRAILSEEYEVLAAETGAEALECIATEGGSLSAILLDLMLPDMHGFDILRRLRSDSEMAGIPVIVLTSDREAEVRSFEEGAVDFIPKPYPEPEVITAHVRRYIELSENNMLDDIQSGSISRVAEALSSDYFSIYYVNAEDERFIEYSSSDEYRDLGIETSGENFFSLSRRNVARFLHPDDRGMFLEAFTKENILSTLREHHAFTLTYRLMLDGVPKHVYMKATLMSGKTDDYIVIGVNDIEEQFKAQEAYERARDESITFARIAQALAGDYFGIYVVDSESKEYFEYTATDEYEKLDLEKKGTDFFNESRENAARVVYPEDYSMFLSQFTEESVMRELERSGIYTLKYRLMFDGRPTWVSLKASLMSDEFGTHIIVGVSSIDAQVRREQEYNYKLSVAHDKANRDPLTGVKSRHAYLDKVAEIEAEIAEGSSDDFAVVICDVNGLKEINDSLGHHAGDDSIKDAAFRVCTTFKHSPVFRIGGDEFAVISKGQDYDNIESLVEEFGHRNERGKEHGAVVVACGFSRHTGDESFADVFERADTAMYENKKALKA